MAYVYMHIREDKNEPFYIGIGNDDNGYKRAYSKRNRNTIGYFDEKISNVVFKPKVDPSFLDYTASLVCCRAGSRRVEWVSTTVHILVGVADKTEPIRCLAHIVESAVG